jgi:ABC-type multidrug transport system ATPase subunit
MFLQRSYSAILIEAGLANATFYAYTTGQDNLLVSIALYSAQDIERLKLCQLQIMEKANKDLLQAKDNTIKELSKGWDNMLNTASQVATDLQYLVNKNTGLDLLMQIEISV